MLIKSLRRNKEESTTTSLNCFSRIHQSQTTLFISPYFYLLLSGQRITTIQLDGVQYFISRMNPYSPELNYFLAYQYCRSLGLQLASFETKEKVESMSQYLQNAGYSKYDFWTSGNRLGTGMFLWMSTGLPFNATFDYFDNANDAVKAGLLDPIDHNSNTAPQRTARDRLVLIFGMLRINSNNWQRTFFAQSEILIGSLQCQNEHRYTTSIQYYYGTHVKMLIYSNEPARAAFYTPFIPTKKCVHDCMRAYV